MAQNQITRQKTKIERPIGSIPSQGKKNIKFIFLFWVGCLGDYDIYITVFNILMQIHMAINNQGY